MTTIAVQKRASIIICHIFLCFFGISQEASTTYRFDMVGWTVTLPHSWKVIDSAVQQKMVKNGTTLIEETNGVKVPTEEMTTLISARQSPFDVLSSTIIPFSTEKDGNYEANKKLAKDVLYHTFDEKLKGSKIDSFSTLEAIDNVSFDKFQVSITLPTKQVMTFVMLSKLYKGYDFGITYLYMSEKIKNEIEGILRESRFKKDNN